MLRLLPLLLVACTGTQDTGKVPVGDTGYGPNLVVPEQYELLWDTDASSCEDDDEDAIIYFDFTGTIDSEGNLDGTESWYWFFKEEGWEDDCYNTFSVTGAEGELGWKTSPCTGCDREFLLDWKLEESEDELACQGYGYESFFDDDSRDRIDEEEYFADILLDTLSPSGNVNENMLVFAFFQDDESEYSYNSRTDARGDYYPDEGSDYATGSATLTWTVSSGMCVSIN